MKKVGKLKLDYLAQSKLNEQEMNVLQGGGTPGDCCCSCWAAGMDGGSSDSENGRANDAKGLSSIYGCEGGDGDGDGGIVVNPMLILFDQYCTC